MNDAADLTDEDRRLLRQILSPSATGGNTTFHVNLGGFGVAVSVCAVLIAVVAVVLQGQRISDMRAAMTAEAAQRAAHEAWAREEANIIRGYIWTGKVPVANPYPKPEQPK